MNTWQRASLALVGVVALGVGVSQLGGGGGALITLKTNTPGLLSGSGTTFNPLSMVIATDVSITGTGSAGSAFSSQQYINTTVQRIWGGFFGTGVDGALNFDGSSTVMGVAPSSVVYKGVTYTGTYVMTRDVYGTSITVCSSCWLNMNGWRLFATGTLTNNGLIADHGNGTGSSAACRGAGYFPANNKGGTAVAGNCGQNGNASSRTFSYVAASSATNGGIASGAGDCSHCAGTTGSVGPATFRGGGGGGGGTCNGNGAGGDGGTTSQRGTVADGVEDFWGFVGWNAAQGTSQSTMWTSGAGGGAGCLESPFNGSNSSGGCGGGILWVAAPIITGGTFGAEGANGGSHDEIQGGIHGGWGGGGGGGGTVALFYHHRSGTTISVAGGIAGTGACTIGAAGNGGNGAAGLSYTFNLSGDGT